MMTNAGAHLIRSCPVLMLALAPGTHGAETIRVPRDAPTIQAAIDLARDGDVVLVRNGTYTGEGNRNIRFQGKAITVRSANGPEDCIVDCEGSGQGFLFLDGEGPESVLEGFSIINGYAAPGEEDSGGGGIRIGDRHGLRSAATIRTCYVIDCRAPFIVGDDGNGGGIYVAGDATIAGTSIAGCYAHRGGGIYVAGGEGMIINNLILSNVSDYGAGGIAAGQFAVVQSWIEGNSTNIGGDAGGISGGRFIRECRILNNHICSDDATSAGGITAAGTVIGCEIGGNINDCGVGGIGRCGYVRDCIIYENRGWSAGGVGLGGSSPGWVVNCLIANNEAPEYGAGAAYFGDDASGSIVHSTLAGNRGFAGSVWFGSTGSPHVENSVIWGNSPTSLHVTAGTPVVRYSDVEGGWNGQGMGNIERDPSYVNPENDFRLRPDSPCIDAADTDALPQGELLDLDGVPRRVDEPGAPNTGVGPAPHPDMGAYELDGWTICVDVRRIRLTCRAGRLRAKIRTNLPEDTAVLLLRDESETTTATVDERGGGKVRWRNQVGEHDVCVAGCPRYRCARADCG